MNIYITAAQGEGSTPLSAFDEALHHAHIFNYNLLILSSIIPPNTVIKHKKPPIKPSEYGYRLYVVKAEARSTVKNMWIGASIGWYQDKTGKGVFVEHSAFDKSQERVKQKLHSNVMSSLHDLCTKRKYKFKKKDLKIKTSMMQIHKKPGCVLVLAVYQSEPW